MHAKMADMTIVVAGGSGFIGTTLTKRLLALGHTVVVVGRRAPTYTHEQLYFINCDIAVSPLPYNILERTDAVINLVGRTIFQKWTPETKAAIHASRIDSTKRIVESIAAAASRPPVFICASATAFYGDTKEAVADEQSENGEDFLAHLVAEWEGEARKASEYGVRVVLMRTAPVLGHGGMLKAFTKTAPFGFLLNLRKRDFAMSWIHEEDIVNAYIFALQTNNLQGVVNAAAPESVSSHTFMQTLGRTIHRRIIGTVPEWLGVFRLGEFYEALTMNSRIAPKRLLDKGFQFQYPDLESALKSLSTIRHPKDR